MNSAADVPVAIIDHEDARNIGANLSALADPTLHNHVRYVLSGPEDVMGTSIVEPAERHAGVKVEKVKYKDTDWIRDLVKTGYPEKILSSILAGCEPIWQGRCSLAWTPTTKEILRLAPPKRTVADALRDMLEE
jgi:hypothetical protein